MDRQPRSANGQFNLETKGAFNVNTTQTIFQTNKGFSMPLGEIIQTKLGGA
jgi:hypothetical protein